MKTQRRVEQRPARCAHNAEVAGSNPAPATIPSRSRRRQDRKRIRARVLRIVKLWHDGWPRDERAVGRYLNHGLQTCSCWQCGNPRRFSKGGVYGGGRLTLRERRAVESAKAEP